MASSEHVAEFERLFKGRTDVYGTFTITGKDERTGKLTGKASTVTDKPLTFRQYDDHVAGQTPLGVVPLTIKDTAWFGAIDIDEYTAESKAVVKTIYDYNLPLCPFESKSGGLHLFLFMEDEIPAKDMVGYLQRYRDLLILKKETEIFPKQTTVRRNDGTTAMGNWINLPYFGETRCMLTRNGDRMPFELGVMAAKQRKTTAEDIERHWGSLPYSDGPPCLQRLTLRGTMEGRNNFLFSVARYFKTKYGDEDYVHRVMDANTQLAVPLPTKEVEGTVLKSHARQDYSYKCKDMPCQTVCDKVLCKTREFGIGGGNVSELDYGAMTQVIDPEISMDAARYRWDVSGKVFNFANEDEIIDQSAFLRQCLRLLHFLPAKLKAENWRVIVNRALSNIVVETLDPVAGFTLGAQFREHLYKFLTDKLYANRLDLITRGSLYKDVASNEVQFLASTLTKHLKEVQNYRSDELRGVEERLRQLGFLTRKMRIGENDMLVWVAPMAVIDKLSAPRAQPMTEREIVAALKEKGLGDSLIEDDDF